MIKKMGFIGFGGMASWHFDHVKEIPDLVEAYAAYDIDPERVKVAESKGMKGYYKLEDILKDKNIDFVLVATPNNFHCELAVAAMNAGKHVICEKPVALSMNEIDQMVAASKRNNVIFTVHQNRRWDYDYRIVRKAIEDGLVGKPYTIESRVFGGWGVMYGWRAYKVAGGGMILDWGVHLIDQILDMYPNTKVKSVYCNTHSVKTPEVDDYFKLILLMENGPSVQIEVGTYCLQGMPRWYVNGDAGSIVLHDWERNGKIIHAKQSEMAWEPEVIQTKAGPTRTMAPRPQETLEEVELPDLKTDSIDFYKNVMNAIDGKEEQIVKHHQIKRVFTVIEAAFKSAETGEAVLLEK